MRINLAATIAVNRYWQRLERVRLRMLETFRYDYDRKTDKRGGPNER